MRSLQKKQPAKKKPPASFGPKNKKPTGKLSVRAERPKDSPNDPQKKRKRLFG